MDGIRFKLTKSMNHKTITAFINSRIQIQKIKNPLSHHIDLQMQKSLSSL